MTIIENNEIDMFEVLADKVRAGEPIHVTGPLSDVVGKMHLAMVRRLRETTGLPVHVVYS